MILFHRTDVESARAIMRDGIAPGRENTGELFCSSRRNGQAVGYGDAVVTVEVDPKWLQLDDEFPDGERHYRVSPEHVRVMLVELT